MKLHSVSVYNNYFYYINTNEIPGELSHENLISSHVKSRENITVAMAT